MDCCRVGTCLCDSPTGIQVGSKLVGSRKIGAQIGGWGAYKLCAPGSLLVFHDARIKSVRAVRLGNGCSVSGCRLRAHSAGLDVYGEAVAEM